jgi:hypothetical protein
MFSSDRGNTSFGSVEGVGGWPGCDSREVELENRYPWHFPVVLWFVPTANIPDNMFVQLQLVICLIVISLMFNLISSIVLAFRLMLFFS